MTSSNQPERPNVSGDSITETFPSQDSAEDTKVRNSVESAEEMGSGNVVLQSSKYETSFLRRILTPKNCRWNDESPPALSMRHCCLYAMVC